MLAQLELRAANDQAELARLVTAAGGLVSQHYWILSMLAVEVPASALPALRAHPRVLRLVPVRSRSTADAQPLDHPGESGVGPLAPPIARATDSNNHCVTAARSILQAASAAHFGDGVRIAIMDSGIDGDASGAPGGVAGTPLPHPSFRQPAPNQSLSRIDAHLRAGTIDCNNILAAGGFLSAGGPWAYRPCRHSS